MARVPVALRVLALACVAGVLPVAAAWGQERPQNGLIAFSAKRGDSRVIYTRRSNGTALRLVPTGPGSDDPAFSVRGKRLLFTRRSEAGSQVWVSYLDGTGQRALTAGPSDGMAQWSPKGDHIVFARGDRGGRDIYRLVADGSGLVQLTRSRRDDHSPTWSKRNRIAFVRSRGRRSHVYVVPSTGGTARRLDRSRSSELSPAWSPTGKTLVLSRGARGKRDLYLVTADGSHTRRLTKVAGDDVDPAFSPDGSRIVFTHKRGGRQRLYVMKVRGKPIRRLPSRSLRVRRLTKASSRSGFATWQPTGFFPLVDAAGDIACDPGNSHYNGGAGVPGACRQKLTSDLLLRDDLTNVFALGDNQYEDGALAKFQTSYSPSWGRMKFLTRPVLGNHEYGTADARGYFDYFNGLGQQLGVAGDRGQGYYSFDVGSWHIIALNSECEHIGGCGVDSPQIDWLRSDLAAHSSAACTLAMWHRPHFTSGSHSDVPGEAEGNDMGDMVPAWSVLYNNNADVILNGHEHFYERFAPLTPAGVSDPARGIREFIAGMGGKSRFGFPNPEPNSEFRSNGFYGVLRLTLRDGAYDWEAVRAPTGGIVDAGTYSCH